MARKKSESLNEAVSAELKAGFDLNKFKSKKGLTSNSKFKTQKWIPFSPAVKNALSISGIPMGHITLARGGSDTGKTTLLIETAVTAQKMGILPVFIITEQKWDFKHAKQMGLQLEEILDIETGEIIDHKGFFIYVVLLLNYCSFSFLFLCCVVRECRFVVMIDCLLCRS